MKKPSGTSSDHSSPVAVSGIAEFYFELIALKNLYRRGWLLRGISRERCESVADHVFATALLAWAACEHWRPDLDRLRVLELALTHELGEIDAGDLTPADNVSPKAKHLRELEGVERVSGLLSRGSRLLDLWHEYEAGETPEAHFVRQIEKLEMAGQAASYEGAGSPDLGEFTESARSRIDDPELLQLLHQLEARRTR